MVCTSYVVPCHIYFVLLQKTLHCHLKNVILVYYKDAKVVKISALVCSFNCPNFCSHVLGKLIAFDIFSNIYCIHFCGNWCTLLHLDMRSSHS